MSNDRPPVYFERHWVPWSALLAIFAGFFAFVGGIELLLDLTGKAKPPMDAPLLQIAVAAATGLFGVLVTWASHVFRTIAVDEFRLQISGGHGFVLLEDITAVAIARGSEVRRLRDDMSLALSPGGLLIPLGGAAGAVGTGMVGVSAIAMARYARSMIASFWMHEAVVAYAPQDSTPLWLIGTRHPEELAAAIKRGAGLAD